MFVVALRVQYNQRSRPHYEILIPDEYPDHFK